MTTLRSRTSTTYTHRPNHILRPQDIPLQSSHWPTRGTHRGDIGEMPWQHMAHTYAWVVEQECIKLAKCDRKTEQWILEQQIFQAADSNQQRSVCGTGSRREIWEEIIYSYEIEADRWMRHEEEARRLAVEREKQKARIIQEELRRIDAKIRHKREAERRKIMEEQARIYREMRERERKSQLKMERAILDAWNDYEERWNQILTTPESLGFTSIPWPTLSQPVVAEDIRPAGIISFLLSQFHSQNQTRKDRIRNAQLRWHPDRFQRILIRVAEEERTQVEEGVGIVARCLNDLMARESRKYKYAY